MHEACTMRVKRILEGNVIIAACDLVEYQVELRFTRNRRNAIPCTLLCYNIILEKRTEIIENAFYELRLVSYLAISF